MRLLHPSILCCFFLWNACAYKSPCKPVGFVNDCAQILNVQQRQLLESFLADLKQQTQVELVVCLIRTIGDDTIENFAEKLFQEWGIGNRKQDTGVLLLVALDDRQVRIETGYGSESMITDAHVRYIIDTLMVPAFKQSRFYDGILSAITYMARLVDAPATGKDHEYAHKTLVAPFIFIIILISFIIGRFFRRATPFVNKSSRAFVATTRRRRSCGWFIGSGDSDNPFKGFGGGRSGGGGGSGKW